MKLHELQSKPTIVVMVGLPGSGKSTWRDKFLSGEDNFVVISSDDEIEALAQADGTDYNVGFKQYIGKATAIAKQKFREAVNSGSNILWDQTNLKPKKRKSILQGVPEGYHRVAVVFEVTQEELTQRLQKREKETGKHVPNKVIKDMANSYSPPTKMEGFDEIKFIR